MNVKKIPFILNIDGGIIGNDSFFIKKIKTYLIRSAYAWLSSGDTTDQYLVHYGAKKEFIRKYPQTSVCKKDIDKDIVSGKEKEQLRRKFGIEKEKVAVFAGQFVYRKGVDVLLKAAALLNKRCVCCRR